MKIAHLTASPFFGGPERQMLELARTFKDNGSGIEVQFLSFGENGNARPFLEKAEQAGFRSIMLENDMPHLIGAAAELHGIVSENGIELLLLHGHKARTVGWYAGKKMRIPLIGVSRGWTTENWKMKIYNRLDKWIHKRLDHIVCVSLGQADKVLKSGVPKDRVSVIHNSIRTERFSGTPDTAFRKNLENMFREPPRFILGNAGRLSPEKGFDVLIEALSLLVKRDLSVGLVIFGEGFLLDSLRKRAENLGVSDSVVFAGFTDELDRFMPNFDVFVQSSHTEGLPNVLLEAMAGRTAVVATEVGGTAEVVEDGKTGLLVPPADPGAIADSVQKILADPQRRTLMEKFGRERVGKYFTFEAQAEAYENLVRRFVPVRKSSDE